MMKHNEGQKYLWSTGIIFVITFCLAGAADQNTQSDVKDLDSLCLYCTCYAVSGCNYTYGCEITDKEVCGPYHITLAYWREGGSPGNNFGISERENYKACATNRKCAEQTIQNYHKRYYKDCNDNGIIDCVDLFRTHFAGPNACKEKAMEVHIEWLKFLECYLDNADDVDSALTSIQR